MAMDMQDAVDKAEELLESLRGWRDNPDDALEAFTDDQLKDALEDRGFSVYAEDESPVKDVDDAVQGLLGAYMPKASLGDNMQLTEKIKAALVELGVSEGVI